jgi:hypothetical protein
MSDRGLVSITYFMKNKNFKHDYPKIYFENMYLILFLTSTLVPSGEVCEEG